MLSQGLMNINSQAPDSLGAVCSQLSCSLFLPFGGISSICKTTQEWASDTVSMSCRKTKDSMILLYGSSIV